MTALVAGAVTFLFTTVLTIAGVGAAFILIPIFVALGIDLHDAMATALLLNAIAMGAASIRFVRRGLVDWAMAVPMLAVASGLSWVGALVSQGLDRRQLLCMFVGFLVFAAGMMLFYQPRPRETVARPALRLGLGAAVGALGGFVGGLLGVGGGNIIVPALVALGIEPKRASATASFIVIFSSLSGFASHASMAGLSAPLLGATAVGSVSAAFVGSWLMTERLKGRQVKVLIGVVLLVVAAKTTWDLVVPHPPPAPGGGSLVGGAS